jgi:hypothetical protein
MIALTLLPASLRLLAPTVLVSSTSLTGSTSSTGSPGGGPTQASVEPGQVVVMVVLLGLVGLAGWGMRRAWRARAARQADVPAPPPLPAAPSPSVSAPQSAALPSVPPATDGQLSTSPPVDRGQVLVGPLEAVYASTTPAGRWTERLVVHDLGVRSPATVTLTTHAVEIDRVGARSFSVPVSALTGVSTRGGIAGATPGGEALVVFTWWLGARDGQDGQGGQHGLLVDTGLQPRHAADRSRLLAATRALLEPAATSSATPGTPTNPAGAP